MNEFFLNSTISTEGAKFMTSNIQNFYLNTSLDCPEDVKIKIDNIPQEIINEFKLNSNIYQKGYLYLKLSKGMYVLKQTGLLAQQLIEE